MPTVNYSTSLSGAGENISRSVPRTEDGVAARNVTLPVGKAGTLTTRTSDTVGTITMNDAGHGITTGQIVDVHWSTGVQYKVTVGTVSGTSVPISGGIGDVLPAQSTAVVVTPRVQINADIDGDALAILGIEVGYDNAASTAKAHAEFQDAQNDQIAELDLKANTPQIWDVDGGSANPFIGDPITKLFASNGSATEVGTLKLIFAADATP